MNKWLYILMNVIAVGIALTLVIFGPILAKVLGIFGLVIIGKEFFSGKYKKYMK